MKQIILKLNLKYILAALSLQQKGVLLDALLNTDEDDELAPDVIAERVQHDDVVANLYKYIFLLQKDINAKQQRMRELGAKGGAARKKNKNTSDDLPLLDLWQLTSDNDGDNPNDCHEQVAVSDNDTTKNDLIADNIVQPVSDDNNLAFDDKKQALLLMQNDKKSSSETDACLSFNGACSDNLASLKPKRKVTKEKFLNIKNNFISENLKKCSQSLQKKHVPKELPVRDFIPPSVEEVKAYVEEKGLSVNPDIFVDFYEARDWFVGKTAIKKWKPIVNLWHTRAIEKQKNLPSSRTEPLNSKNSASDDEMYWSALQEKVNAQGDAPMVDENLASKLEVTTVEERTFDEQVSSLPIDARQANSNNSDERKDLPSLQTENMAQNSDLSLVGKFDSDILSAPQTSAQSLMNDYAGLSPFTRFMRRIEDNDLSPEEKK